MRPKAKAWHAEHDGALPGMAYEREASLSSAPYPAPMASYSQAPSASLADQLSALDESFSQSVLRLVDERGMTDAQCYKRANISKQVFSRLRSNPQYKPSKPTALALAVALELDPDETRALLEEAGLTLSHSLKLDVIVEFFLNERRFNVMEINEVLFDHDQPLLGAK